MDYFEIVKQSVHSHQEMLCQLSDHIWDLAETKFEEYQSSDFYCRVLEENGFAVQRGIGGLPTAFKGSFGTGKPVIGYLGEFDALPGLDQKAGSCIQEPSGNAHTSGHGCGHHILGGGAFGAALALKDYLIQTGRSGTVIFYGCPAEEGGSGKAWMVREHVFDECDTLFSWHPGNTNMVLPRIFLASIQSVFTFKGVAAHAAACPHLGRSALDAVELMNVGVNFLREHVPTDVKMHYAITDAGGNAANIVQAHASVLYQLRAPRMSEVNSVYERVKRIAQGAAMMTDTTVEVKFNRCCSDQRLIPALDEIVYENLLRAGPVPVDQQDIDFAREIRKTFAPDVFDSDARDLAKRYGKEGAKCGQMIQDREIVDVIPPLETEAEVSFASSDVGDVSQVKPVSQIMVSCFAKDTPAHSWQLVAQGKKPLAHKAMLHTSLVLGASGARLMEDPALLEKIQEQFDESCQKDPYAWPIPADAQPPLPTR